MEPRATVIIPTFGHANFARWAINSVQQQTIKEIEICVICDGSPAEMVSFFEDMAREDPRIHVFQYPKSPRTGEPYRDEVIKRMKGKIICYCCHDDLWLPNHIETMEETLKKYDFTHTIHAAVNMPENIKEPLDLFLLLYWVDLKDDMTFQNIFNGINSFGLTYGAHTKESYLKLAEGWTTTPKEVPTDQYMWRKFLSASGVAYKTTMKITALNFPLFHRRGWSEQDRDDELKSYFYKILDPSFLNNIEEHYYRHYQKEIARQYIEMTNMIHDVEKSRDLIAEQNQGLQNQVHEMEKSRDLILNEKEKMIAAIDEKDNIICQLRTSSLYRVLGRWVKYRILKRSPQPI